MLSNPNLKYLLILLPALLMLGGCSKKNAMSEDKFVKVYADLVIAQDTTNTAGKGMEELKQKVFSRYGITESEYRATVKDYNKNPEKWEQFFKKVIAYVDELKKKSGS